MLGDRIQLQQVILNLVMNGIEAMSAVTDRSRELLIRSCPYESDKVLVAVQDSGTGLEPESLDHLLTAFYTTKPKGMGMGLAISRSIIEAHGGRLWAVPERWSRRNVSVHVAHMMELSEYLLETLREDGEFILYRGRQPRRPLPVLVLAPVSEQPRAGKPQAARARILLAGRADPAWAVRPLALVQPRGPDGARARGSRRRAPRSAPRASRWR